METNVSLFSKMTSRQQAGTFWNFIFFSPRGGEKNGNLLFVFDALPLSNQNSENTFQ